MEKEKTVFNPEANAVLIYEVVEKISARTPKEQTVLSEVLLRALCWQSLESYGVISFLTADRVNVKQVMALDLAPTRARLSEEQEKAVAVATIFYGVFKASKELTSSEKIINAAVVFEWLRDLVAKRVEEKGPFDRASQYHMDAIAILTELAE